MFLKYMLQIKASPFRIRFPFEKHWHPELFLEQMAKELHQSTKEDEILANDYYYSGKFGLSAVDFIY